MSDLVNDIRYAARMLLKSPLFTGVAVLSLALGIGANTTIFTLVDRILLNPLPVLDPSRLVSFYTTDSKNAGQFLNFLPTSFLNYRDQRDHNERLSGMAAFQGTAISVSSGGEPKQSFAELVTGNYFDVLGVQPAYGRFFSFTPAEDEQLGSNPVVVLNYDFWQQRFGASTNLVGQNIILNRQNFTVLGVAPRNFRGINAVGGPDMWIPMNMRDQVLASPVKERAVERRALVWSVVARLKPGAQIAQAEAAARTIAARLEKEFPADNDSRSAALRSVNEGTFFSPEFRKNVTSSGAVLMGVVGLVLLIACANVANLLLARAAGRQREVAVRISLGASRARLIRQLMTESVLLALVAGLAGIVIAKYSRDLLWSMRPPFLQNGALDLTLDWKILLFTFAISLFTGLLFGLFPALQLSRPDHTAALKDRTGQPSHSNRVFSLRGALVMTQVALSLVALVGAGLFLRSLQNAQRINPGFDAQGMALLRVNTGAEGYANARAEVFHNQMLERVRALPGVTAVTIASGGPFAGGFSRTVFREGVDTTDRRNGKLTALNEVLPGFFETMGIPILRGRSFTATDREGAPMVAVINETMARRLWNGEDAVGKRFRCFGENWIIEIVGIARDGKYFTLGEEPQQYMYFPLLQHPAPAVTLHLRAKGDVEATLGAARAAVQTLDTQMPITGVLTVAQLFERNLWAPRMAASLLAGFGILALLLAALGVHGVISYNVAQRTQEIGIRMALGARPSDVLLMVMRHTLATVAIGAAIGLAAAFAVARSLTSLLFDVGAGDPLTLAGTTALILIVAMLASFLPARRASRVDPLVALRYE